jgi:putative ABC transport system permease protein
MKLRKLGTTAIALQNLKSRIFRTICLCSLVAVLSFTVFSAQILIYSLKNGMNSVEERLGADLMIVPDGNKTDIEGVLLRGEPGAFYFNKKTEDVISGVKGISKLSSQFFISSLSVGCCSFPIQLIGYDPTTDFVIAPWISSQIKGKLKDGQLVVGSRIDAAAGGILKFFGHKYQVVTKLEETGMGFDTSVFMNFDTAQKLLDSARQIGVRFKIEGSDQISAIMVKAENGVDPEDLGDRIIDRLEREGIKADLVIPQNITSSVSQSISKYIIYIRIFSIMLWLLALILLTVVFTFSIHERKKEIAVLRVLGATRIKLLQLIFGEAAIIGAAGGIAGIFLAGTVIFLYSTYIGMLLGTPYVLPQLETIAAITAASFLVSFGIGPVASSFSAYRIGRNEIHITMREGE